jgi:hypothetical protein
MARTRFRSRYWNELARRKRWALDHNDLEKTREETEMASGTAGGIAPDAIPIGKYTPLNRQQIVGFWAAWFGWMLDGMDSVIYALVLGPALTELLPRHGVTDIHGGVVLPRHVRRQLRDL